jgi:hypothetical protein
MVGTVGNVQRAMIDGGEEPPMAKDEDDGLAPVEWETGDEGALIMILARADEERPWLGETVLVMRPANENRR